MTMKHIPLAALAVLGLLSSGCLSMMPERVQQALYRQSIDVTVLSSPSQAEAGGVELWAYSPQFGCVRALLPGADFARAARNLIPGQRLRVRSWDLATVQGQTLLVRSWEGLSEVDPVAATFGSQIRQQCQDQNTKEVTP